MSSPILRALFCGLMLLGCPPSEQKAEPKKDGQPAPCVKVGQSCEYSPGKLGTCVMKDACTEQGSACFVCQSQH